MCNIIYAPNKSDINEDTIRRSWNSNNDGAGFIARTNKGVRIHKGIMELDLLLNRLRSLPSESEVAVHLRFGTHGLKRDRLMTHPFKIREGIWLMHNGILGDFICEHRPNSSDSAILADDLSRVPLSGIRRLLESLHGKFLLSHARGFELFGQFEESEGMLQSSAPVSAKWAHYGHVRGYTRKWEKLDNGPVTLTRMEGGDEVPNICTSCYMPMSDCYCGWVEKMGAN